MIKEKGFQAVAVEADWPDAYCVDRYVRGRSKDSGPILIRIDTNSGHGASSLSKALDEEADVYSFLFHNLGVTPKY